MPIDVGEVLAALDGLEFVRSIYPATTLPEPDQAGEVRVLCPFHDDHNPSGLFNVRTKVYYCGACGAGGSAVDLLARITKQPRHAAAEYLARQLNVGPTKSVEPAGVEGFHANLKINAGMQRELLARKGLDAASIIKFRLGWNDAEKRLVIPIFASTGELLNVRQYDLLKIHDAKRKYVNLKGHGALELFNRAALESEEIFVAEGELKAIGLEQRGFRAISATGGASGWKAEWDRLFESKKVRIVYDVDETGTARARALARRLHGVAAEVKVISLPLDVRKHPHGDVLDYFVIEGYGPQDFRNLELGTALFDVDKYAPGLRDDLEYEVDLSSASRAQYHLRKVKLQVIVSAKDTAPYVVPKTVQVSCSRNLEICAACPVFAKSDETCWELEPDEPELLDLIEVKKAVQQAALKALVGIPSKCDASELVSLESFNLEEVRLVPQLNAHPDSATSSEHVVARAYHVGHGIETNSTYEIKSRCVVDPRDQHATQLIYDARPNVDSLTAFNPPAEEMAELEIFRPASWDHEALDLKLDHIYRDLELNVTRIYQRRALHVLMDLVWHSVLYVTLDREPAKGWVDALVIGDSGQGKSETSLRLLRHYGVGERVDMKGASVAGLKGGLQDTQGRWFVTWGVIPLNDRRLVVLEEVKGCPPEVLASLTDMRSSGLAELAKIERRRAFARTRLLWISNPRSDRKVDTYSFGAQAIKELMGSLEDVRRFDAALVVSSNEVDPAVINNLSVEETPHVYTAEKCRRLILWAWSRRADQVIIEPEAKRRCAELAVEQGRRYSSGIPLVEPADHRLKLARLAAALAGRTYSADEAGRLIVRACHVDYVAAFLDAIYSSRFMGYDVYSQVQKLDATLTDESEVRAALTMVPHVGGLVRGLIRATEIRATDLDEWAGAGKDTARDVLAALVRCNALRRSGNGYYKTGPFIEFLKTSGLDGIKPPDFVGNHDRGAY